MAEISVSGEAEIYRQGEEVKHETYKLHQPIVVRDDRGEVDAKLKAANAALQCFAPDTRIERRKGGWYVCFTTWNRRGEETAKRWQTRGGQDFYPTWSRHWPHGGTACTALSQLIRWLRGQPVLSIASWQYWSGETCKLLRQGDADAAIQGLLDAGYPEVSTCVLCDVSPMESVDWWNLDGVSGPCCSWRSGCRQEIK